MNEKEKVIREWIKKQINDCTMLIQAVSDMDSKKGYAKDRTKFKEVLNLIDKQDKVIKEYETLLKRQEKLEQEKDILKKQGWL